MKKAIVYFSWSNNTRKLVEGIQKEIPELDVYRIERKVPYSTDYEECAYHQAKEEVEKNIHPEIRELEADFSQYDKILLFFPIWWYTFPMPVATFLLKHKDYRGKVILFANSYTNDSQYMQNSLRDAKALAPDVSFKEGLFNRKRKDHIEFIKEDKER